MPCFRHAAGSHPNIGATAGHDRPLHPPFLITRPDEPAAAVTISDGATPFAPGAYEFTVTPPCPHRERALIILGPDRKDGYRIGRQHERPAFALPKPGTGRRVDYVPGTNFTIRQTSRTRSKLYRGQRLVGYTTGIDSAAAGLAFWATFPVCHGGL
jgi:hypothetical protein